MHLMTLMVTQAYSIIVIHKWFQYDKLQGNLVNSTSDNSKTCLTQTKFHGPCLGNDNLVGISRTFSHNWNWKNTASAIKLPFPKLDVFTFLCNMPNFSVLLFKWEKNLAILESLAWKLNTLERNGLAMVGTWLMHRESITHNSNFSWLKLFGVSAFYDNS